MNRFTVIMAVVVIGFIATVFILGGDNDRTTSEPSNHTVGEGTSGVTLVEYADFQCPACGQYFPIISAVKDAYGDEITFEFRHFSLFGNFPNSMAAHLAAESAGNQDMFFEMHDLIFERQNEWSQSNNAQGLFEGYAEELGLDMDQFREDYGNSETRGIINADIARGNDQGVTGTPTFFIRTSDGTEQRLENPTSPEEFFQIIDEYIEQETGEPSQNSPLNQEDADLPEGFDFSDDLPEQTQDTPE